MLDEELRRVGPPSLSDERHAHLRESLMDHIQTEAAKAERTAKASTMALPAKSQSGGRRRHVRGGRRFVGAAVAAVCVVATAGAAAATVAAVLRPDPKQAATVIEHSSDQVQWHNPGWRPELQAELVNCVAGKADNGPAESVDTPHQFEAYASDFPLTRAIKSSDYVRACTSKAQDLESGATTEPKLCVDSSDALPTPVVLMNSESCQTTGLRGATESDLAALNSARRTEVSLLAFPQNCPTAEQARAWLQGRLDTSDPGLKLANDNANAHPSGPSNHSTTTTATASASDTGSGDRACYRGFVDWKSGTVTIDAYSLPG